MSRIGRLSRRIDWRLFGAPCSTVAEGVLGIAEVRRRLEEMTQRHATLSEKLADGAASVDCGDLHKELADLEPVVTINTQLAEIQKQIEDLRSLAQSETESAEMKGYAADELALAEKQMRDATDELVALMVPPDEDDDRDVVLEVRAGVGGTEGALFALDLFRMYQRYAQMQKWKMEVMEVSRSEMDGIKFASLSLSGKGAFGRMKVENGVHRVQRVPLTEKAGRLQTSAASVVVMQQPHEVEVVLPADELRIDVYRASGAGGQHVNTTESAVRITHLPTKISVAIQDERSQHKNKDKAMRLMRAKLYEMKKRQQAREQSANRRQSIGSGDRSARIRTYNYAQDRVTDHRIHHTEHGVAEMMEGLKLDAFLDLLISHRRLEKLKELMG